MSVHISFARPQSYVVPRYRGFTLVELLVVIGIIAALIAILLPSLNNARKAAMGIKCGANMRQLLMANQMFAAEHDGISIKHDWNAAAITFDWWNGPVGEVKSGKRWYTPNPAPNPATTWKRYDDWFSTLNALYLKNKNVFLCPADTTGYTFKNEVGDWTDGPNTQEFKFIKFPGSYRLNCSNQPSYGEAFKSSVIKNTTSVIVFAEGVPPTWEGDYYTSLATWSWLSGQVVGPNTTANVAYKRHSGKSLRDGKANYAFMDGHVEMMNFNDTWTNYGGPADRPINMWRQLYLKDSSGGYRWVSNP